MFHVDAKGDTNGDANTSDDVTITADGRVGVGTTAPQTRLHIVSSTPGAIRIADGTEGGGKVLLSDNDGAARWAAIAGSWYAMLRGGSSLGDATATGTLGWPDFVYASSESSSQEPNVAIPATGIITIPYEGTYRITITGKAHTNRATAPYNFLSYIGVYKNDALDRPDGLNPHQHSFTAFGAMNFGFVVHFSFAAGDEIQLKPMKGNFYANRYTDVLFLIEQVK